MLFAHCADKDGITLIARNKPIDRRIDAGGRQGQHDSPLVGGGNDQPVFGRIHQIAAGFAVSVIGDFVQKTGLAQFGRPNDGTDHLALCIANGGRRGENRRIQRLAQDRFADIRPSLLDCIDQVIPVQIIDADALPRERRIGNRRTVKPGNKDAAVKQHLKNRTRLKVRLHGCRVIEQYRRDLSGHFFERSQAVIQLLIDLCSKQGNRRKLLLAQHALHVVAQHPADVERQRPDAEQEHRQRKQHNSGFERIARQDR